MKSMHAALTLILFAVIESVLGSLAQNTSISSPFNINENENEKENDLSDRENEKYIEGILSEQDKEGIYISSYVGDYYMAIKNNKLVAVKSVKEANMFDVSTKEEDDIRNFDQVSSKVQLLPWVEGERRVITYNPVGEKINIEIPIDSNEKTLADITVFQKVIAMDVDFPVYEIKSAQREMCITLDPATKEYFLKQCSNGANDLQTFKFCSYSEALTAEARKKGENAFDMKMFLVDTKVPFSPAIIVDSNGVLYKE